MTLIAGSGTPWRAAAGSVSGREHRRLGRNNQDAARVRWAGDRLVAVVADGCSMGRASEVGAQLGAAWIAGWLLGAPLQDVAIDLGNALDRFLGGLLAELPEPPASAAADLLLFGFLALVIDGDRATILGLGDGVFQLDGARTMLS